MIRSILYIIAVALVVSWSLCFLFFNVGSVLHIIAPLSIISVIFFFAGDEERKVRPF